MLLLDTVRPASLFCRECVSQRLTHDVRQAAQLLGLTKKQRRAALAAVVQGIVPDLKPGTPVQPVGWRRTVLDRDQAGCRYCGCPKSVLTFDHVFPKARGGRYTAENIVLACFPCNNQKGCRTPEEAGMPLRPVPASETERTEMGE